MHDWIGELLFNAVTDLFGGSGSRRTRTRPKREPRWVRRSRARLARLEPQRRRRRWGRAAGR